MVFFIGKGTERERERAEREERREEIARFSYGNNITGIDTNFGFKET